MENKSKAFGVRATPSVRKHIKAQAAALGTTVSDMLVVSAFVLGQQVKGPSDYMRVKAELMADDKAWRLLAR